jgi:small subunit ribosomal protein S9
MAKSTKEAVENVSELTKAQAKKGPDKGGFYWGVGRRKSSVARVRLKPGEGKVVINNKDMSVYFKLESYRKMVQSPLMAVSSDKKFDVFINVNGGGTTGQCGAAILGIARALKNYDETFAQPLREGGFLTRDQRMVERKKPGQSGARRRYQFSKR